MKLNADKAIENFCLAGGEIEIWNDPIETYGPIPTMPYFEPGPMRVELRYNKTTRSIRRQQFSSFQDFCDEIAVTIARKLSVPLSIFEESSSDQKAGCVGLVGPEGCNRIDYTKLKETQKTNGIVNPVCPNHYVPMTRREMFTSVEYYCEQCGHADKALN